MSKAILYWMEKYEGPTKQKWIAWLDSINETHEQETRLLFAWLTKEHNINRQTIFNPAEWSLHTGPPPGMQVPLQSNGYDCGIFICLYAAFLDMRLPLCFSQHDTRNVRMWMAHEMIEEGKILKMSHSVLNDSLLATARDKSKTKSDNAMACNRSPESQVQGDKKRQKNYEQEANEEQKNVQAAAEFWAAMRQTNGFQNQTTGPQFQAEAVNAPLVRSQGLPLGNKRRPPSRARGIQKEEGDQTMNTIIQRVTH
jgi:hypothetical protein